VICEGHPYLIACIFADIKRPPYRGGSNSLSGTDGVPSRSVELVEIRVGDHFQFIQFLVDSTFVQSDGRSGVLTVTLQNGSGGLDLTTDQETSEGKSGESDVFHLG